jgi:hypothetical protein
MSERAVTEKKKREDLIAKSNQLFWRFLNNPKDTHLAIEIKAFDDQIAASTQRLIADEKKAEQREKKDARPYEGSTES